MTRQQYTPEFKSRAVALLLESGKSVARMAQKIDIKENTLYIYGLPPFCKY
ncbi:transposase [Pectobacterium parmentieri]|uniref:transposase n=1 Tax=Pectobacterium parmentieri TaxID=1905730 RepID=UPI0013745841|nr:transposase [Pectobacterium parmentieri]QHQ15304.1 transposase [Pectobacterium parmentieri]